MALQAKQSTSPLRMDFYDRWVLSLYGDQLVKKFGSLEAVDPNLIPVGLDWIASGSPNSQGPAPPPLPPSLVSQFIARSVSLLPLMLLYSTPADVDLTHTPDMPPRRYPAPPPGTT
ncbi:hypothetical protein C8R44DRAFT_876069 [Mycena epipterygia]|nr:hypothetical protein C8R44DRAFT_876069 [Mycena epipterygia]